MTIGPRRRISARVAKDTRQTAQHSSLEVAYPRYSSVPAVARWAEARVRPGFRRKAVLRLYGYSRVERRTQSFQVPE
jgi:hypothetical protein